MALFYIALLTAAGRSHGIGGWAVLRLFAIIAFTVAMGYGAYHLYGLYFAPLALVTLYGLTTGHGRFFAMQGASGSKSILCCLGIKATFKPHYIVGCAWISRVL